MAVTIDDLQVEVRRGGKSAQEQAPAAAPGKERMDLRQQISLLAERSLRLTTE
jgi:hypothetical protein